MQRRADEATAELRAALVIAPGSADTYAALAAKYTQVKFMRASSAALEQAIALRPDVGDWHRRLGVAYKAMRQHDAALAAFHTSLRLDFVRFFARQQTTWWPPRGGKKACLRAQKPRPESSPAQ